MLIRPARAEDCAAIADLWNSYIRDSNVTFNSQEKTAAGLADDLARKATDGMPFLLAEAATAILGFATYGQFRASNGYARTMEHTVILSPTASGRGVGRALMAAIEDHARGRGVHSMLAGVSAANPDGIRFHAAIGYLELARLPEVGRKFDQWFDLVLMQKML